jgi:8-oxo-dGTP pyrophosphatase MutT (NUDIX family)
MDKNIHEVQGSILKALLLHEVARFSELNTNKLSTDQFTFHIKQLTANNVIEKTANGSYRLTIPGKEYASRFDIDSGPVKIEKQAKLGVLIVVVRDLRGKKEYLMQTHLKQPFFGFRGFITGKIKMGESVPETAARELAEEAGLQAVLEHKSMQHERIFSKENELLEDKYFHIFLGRKPSGTLLTEFEGGKNEWIPEADVLKGNIFYEIADLLKLVQQNEFAFSEKSYTVEKY